MKRIISILVMILGISIIVLASIFVNNKDNSAKTLNDFMNISKGTARSEIIKKFGNPDGELSGLYGDIYFVDNKKVIINYYSNDYVLDVNVFDKEEVGKKDNDFTIIDKTVTENIPCATAMEKFYEDEVYEYFFPCIKSSWVIVKYNNGDEVDIKSALQSGLVTVNDLRENNIDFYEEEKYNTFMGTILEINNESVLIQPFENTEEYKYSDKIYFTYSKDKVKGVYNNFPVGSVVMITHTGIYRETYPPVGDLIYISGVGSQPIDNE